MTIDDLRAGLIACNVPEHLHDGLVRYMRHGVPTGSFLRAVLENDLRGALARAHPSSLAGLRAIVTWLETWAPPQSWGSVTVVRQWLDQHRPGGREEEAIRFQAGVD